jgi:hypothetical protein
MFMPASAQLPLSRDLVNVPPGNEALFRENYNQRPFVLEHHLPGHPLLELAYLVAVAQSFASEHPERLYYTIGNKNLSGGWDYTTQRKVPPKEAIDQIQTANTWLILKGVQVLPEYRELLDQFLQEIHAVSGREWKHVTASRNLSIIITSPKQITPYHMDADCNYLLQIAGVKTVYVFNGADRNVVTAEELESFYSGQINAAQYREASQKGAWQFDLTPGHGVHIPVTFPHWVENGDNVSISVSINFRFVDRTVPDIYRLNSYLRRLRLHPRLPGESALSDGVKKLASKTLRALRRKHDE